MLLCTTANQPIHGKVALSFSLVLVRPSYPKMNDCATKCITRTIMRDSSGAEQKY
ncbi:hypothetical protein PI125_g458 [Phytophthora idaei]|nr:hypothetical protein PI125_g458 [Phytophthora idaei]